MGNRKKTRLDSKSIVRAFRITYDGFPEGIYFSTAASKAKAAAFMQAKDSGYFLNFLALRVKRAPEFDRAAYCGKTLTVGMRTRL